jgi:hypothetical protein
MRRRETSTIMECCARTGTSIPEHEFYAGD